MSAPELVPAGWLSAPDLLARFCDHLHDLSERPLTVESAASLAALCIADAMAGTRPGVAAFVQAEGRTFMLPGQVWRSLADPSGEAAPDLVATFTTGRCRGRAFGEYQGLQILFSYTETMIWLAPVARLAAVKAGGVSEAGSDDAPWLPGKPTPWLESDASDEWANARLKAAGLRVDERGRRIEFAKAIQHHRAAFSESSIATVRDRAGKRLRP